MTPGEKAQANMNQKPSGEIIIYRTEDGHTQLDVRLEQETIWLSLNQMATLFERDKSVISRHLRNIFQALELKRDSVVAKNATTAPDGKTYMVEYFNLDAVLSVGYRVNSRRGTQFRIWATQVLKDHILKGYSINEKRLREENVRLKELKAAVDILGRIIEERQLAAPEAEGLLKVVTDYSLALNLLDDYDHGRLTVTGTTEPAHFVITDDKAYKAIRYLAQKSEITAAGIFGLEKDDSFKGSIGAIYQTFDGRELYPSIEEKAAHLLYFVVKNHSFVDGNKRIAAFLFLWFLDGNGILYRKDGTKRIGDNTLVALTLMIAESRAEEKDVIIKVIVNLINRANK
jgi:prophage maintenance system killer protein